MACKAGLVIIGGRIEHSFAKGCVMLCPKEITIAVCGGLWPLAGYLDGRDADR